MGKGTLYSSKVNDTKGFLTLGHSNWNICGLLTWFRSANFSPFYPASHNKPFPAIQDFPTERRKLDGVSCVRSPFVLLWYGGKGNSLKVNETKVFPTLGHSNWTIFSLFTGFCSKKFHLFTQPPIINIFLLPKRCEGRKEQGLKMGKDNSPKGNETQRFMTLGH